MHEEIAFQGEVAHEPAIGLSTKQGSNSNVLLIMTSPWGRRLLFVMSRDLIRTNRFSSI